MDTRSRTERALAMSEGVWVKHANPWSGWSRLTIPPLFALAVWSRDWIGVWSLVTVGLVIFWTWWNPRAFQAPTGLDNWMSQAVLGERIWLDRSRVPLPARHRRVPMGIAVVSGVGLLPLALGLWHLDLWPTLAGLIVVLGGKLWFLDRMVWLRQDHLAQRPAG